MSGTDRDERKAAAVEKAASRRSRKRRLRQIRPGWWVYSYGAADLGSWGQVSAVTAFVEPRSGREMVRLAITDPTGAGVETENVPGYPTWSLTAAEARRCGLRS